MGEVLKNKLIGLGYIKYDSFMLPEWLGTITQFT